MQLRRFRTILCIQSSFSLDLPSSLDWFRLVVSLQVIALLFATHSGGKFESRMLFVSKIGKSLKKKKEKKKTRKKYCGSNCPPFVSSVHESRSFKMPTNVLSERQKANSLPRSQISGWLLVVQLRSTSCSFAASALCGDLPLSSSKASESLVRAESTF